MTDISLLDRNITEVFNDRSALDRLITSVSLQKHTDYIDALERLHEAIEGTSPNSSVRHVLDAAGVSAAGIEADVRLLERRDREVAGAFERETEHLRLEQTDARGMVRLDQQAFGHVPAGAGAEPLNEDIGSVLGDPQEFERRLQRARRAAPGVYDTDEGRQRFREEDRRHAEAGIDLVRSLERPKEIRAAQAKQTETARRLDRAIRNGGDPQQRQRLLDEAITDSPNLKAEPGGVPDDLVSFAGRVQARMRAEGKNPVDGEELLKALESLRAEDAQADAPKVTPPGYTPASYELDRRVRQRLCDEGRPDSEYAKVLEQVLADDARGF